MTKRKCPQRVKTNKPEIKLFPPVFAHYKPDSVNEPHSMPSRTKYTSDNQPIPSITFANQDKLLRVKDTNMFQSLRN